VATESPSKLVTALRIAVGIGVAAVFYTSGVLRNRGVVPAWLDNVVINIVLPLLVIPLGVFYVLWRERQALGDVPSRPFELGSGEELLFRGSFMSGQFYPQAESFTPTPSLKTLLTGPITTRGFLKVVLTNTRLWVGTILGRTWRIIPLPTITRVAEIHGNYPYRAVLVIEYLYRGRNEAVLLWNKSAKGREFTKAIETARSGRAGADPGP
jgi:hypothetical protein